MKKIMIAGFVATASLGLGACAEPVTEEAPTEEEAVVEEDTATILPPEEVPAEDMMAEDAMDGEDATEAAAMRPATGDGPAPVATAPNGDQNGPRPSID